MLLATGSMFAQPKSVGTPRLLIDYETGLMSPKWSPDGSKIAVTGANFQGIWVANTDGSSMKCITTDDGAGYKMAWNADSKTILGRTNVIKNKRVFHELKTYNATTGENKTLVQATRNLNGTALWNGENVKFSENKQTVSLKRNLTRSNANFDAYEKMVTNPFEATKQIASLNQYSNQPVINPAKSLDGKKIAFQIPGKGVFACNIDGTNVKSFGNGSYASWLPDNKHILVSVTTDNGEVFTSSELHIINVETGNRSLLFSQKGFIPLKPAMSPNGNEIAFEHNGKIYLLDVNY